MKQIDIEAEMAKLAASGDLYFLDMAIEYYESYLQTTQNQLNHMIRECVKAEQIVKSLTKLRDVASDTPVKPEPFEKI